MGAPAPQVTNAGRRIDMDATHKRVRLATRAGACVFLLLIGASGGARAQSVNPPGSTSAQAAPPAETGTLEIYGFGQADAIADFNQTHPDWYDVLRPSRLPSFPNEFGEQPVVDSGRLCARRRRQQRPSDAEGVQGRSIRLGQPAEHTREERDDRRRAAMGAP
jgi:hypothetical protein